MILEAAAEDWIADHPAARHLERTRDWVLKLDPTADEAMRIAALTHDVERRVPGGPTLDARTREWDDPEYLRQHADRSAAIVDEWLERQGAARELRDRVRSLVRAHETGGSPEADVVQAADSLSFLENNAARVIAWVNEGRCDRAKARRKLDWMRDRISISGAKETADRLHELAVTALESAHPERG